MAKFPRVPRLQTVDDPFDDIEPKCEQATKLRLGASDPRSREVRMLRNDQWPAVIHDLLRGSDSERSRARGIMRWQVIEYVVHIAHLPIGPPAGHHEQRRRLSMRVLHMLELDGCAHLREWERRQLEGHEAASWWSFIELLARHHAIEDARAVVPADRVGSAEGRPSTAQLLARCDEAELYRLLDRLNRRRALMRDVRAAPGPEPRRPPPGPPVLRRRNPGR